MRGNDKYPLDPKNSKPRENIFASQAYFTTNHQWACFTSIREVSEPRDWYLNLSYVSEFWVPELPVKNQSNLTILHTTIVALRLYCVQNSGIYHRYSRQHIVIWNGDSVQKTLVQILHSAEEDNLSPFDLKIACLCQRIEINNNRIVIWNGIWSNHHKNM